MRFRLAPLLSVPLFAAVVAFSACSNEAEGEPCSPDNGNDDCVNGLACIPPRNSHATNAADVCCPPDPTQATTPECTANGSVDGGNPAPPDGSTMPDTSTASDSHADSTKSDAASEGSSDAPADGSQESSSSGDASDGGAG
jgi:hypothetical protein